MSEEFIVPDKYSFPETSSREHWHTPSSGGEICWNNQQWATRMNAIIKEYNKTIDEKLRLLGGEQDHIPYISVPPHPTRAYNVHHHTSEFDGGLIFGAGLHDHRSLAEGGFAYAVYHPGTSLPSKAYEIEEVYQ